MRVGLYIRTSTANGQTTKNQERELQAIAERDGWEAVAVYLDQSISGSRGQRAPWPRQAAAGSHSARHQRGGRLVLITGVRKSEFIDAAWDEVDFDKGL
ncbi:recombinase family protein [Bradyrhizobium lablabi]|uniref:recombinase family protein n=1 Tax=Bradyrhizobium lablabi TaxID=722472 RepID=UPI001BA59696|nr:recombinase family protein [Bradyrhizobium lablabi]MBR0696731.1 recombinase family protein [Bradyrhizobium lablabi]